MTTTAGSPTSGALTPLTHRPPSRFDPFEQVFERIEVGEEMDALATTAAAGTTLRSERMSAPRPPRRGPGFAETVAQPSSGQRRHCYMALETGRVALAADPVDPWAAVPEALAQVNGARQRAARPVVELHARTLLLRMPKRVELADAVLRQAVANLTDSERRTQPQRCGRLFVSHGLDATEGPVFAYETHPARLVGGTRDLWMSRRLAAHLMVGRHISGFAGVIVSTPRCDAAATHTLPDGRTHALGRCATCSDVAVRS